MLIEVVHIPGKGRGVCAAKTIPKDTVVETCPLLLLGVPLGESHPLEGYAFRYSKSKIALVLGFGSLYNHSFDPNIWFDLDRKGKLVHVTTTRKIVKHEELCINYAGSCTDPDEANLWFKVK